MSGFVNIPDINLLPQEYRQPILSRRQIGVIFLIVVLLVGTLVIYQSKSSTSAEIVSLETEMNEVQGQLESLEGKEEEAQRLQDQTEEARQQLEQIKQAEGLISSRKVNWASFISYFFGSQTPEITLKSVSTAESGFVLKGSSAPPNAVWDYYKNLSDTPEIQTVEVQSLSETTSSSDFTFYVQPKQ